MKELLYRKYLLKTELLAKNSHNYHMLFASESGLVYGRRAATLSIWDSFK